MKTSLEAEVATTSKSSPDGSCAHLEARLRELTKQMAEANKNISAATRDLAEVMDIKKSLLLAIDTTLPDRVAAEFAEQPDLKAMSDAEFADAMSAICRKNGEPIARMLAYFKVAADSTEALEGVEKRVQKLRDRIVLQGDGCPEGKSAKELLTSFNESGRIIRKRRVRVVTRLFEEQRKILNAVCRILEELAAVFATGDSEVASAARKNDVGNLVDRIRTAHYKLKAGRIRNHVGKEGGVL